MNKFKSVSLRFIFLSFIVGLVTVLTACNNDNAQSNSSSNSLYEQGPYDSTPDRALPLDFSQQVDDPYMYNQSLYDQPIPYRSDRGNFTANDDGRVWDQDGQIGSRDQSHGRAYHNDRVQDQAGNSGNRDHNRGQAHDDGRVRDQDGRIGNEDDEHHDLDRIEAQKVAERLTDLATDVDQVNDATAIVVGRYAIVGLDVDAKLDRSKVGSIKYSVAEALKADPHGAYAVVTADPDLTFRLREMRKEIREGRPLAGIMDELAGIVGRLMPQVPRGVAEPENSEGTPKSPEEQEGTNR